MKHVRISTAFAAYLLLGASANAADVVKRIEVVNYTTLAQAVAEAKTHFVATPDDNFTIELPAGRFVITPPPDMVTAIDLLHINPGLESRFTIRGAGMEQTTIVVPLGVTAILGRHLYRTTIQDIHFTKAEAQLATQGHVVSVAPGKVTLRIQLGFPYPNEGYDPDATMGIGRYLRQYTDSPTDPQLIPDNNNQIAWESVTHIGGRTWQFNLNSPTQVAPYSYGMLIGVKHKRGGDSYRFVAGDDIRFERIKWTAESRGIFIDVNHPAVIDSRIERNPPINGQVPALSTNGGGPQIQGKNFTVHGVELAGNVFVGTGDDGFGLFNVEGLVANNNIRDSFARGIYVMYSPDLVLSGNTTVRAPVVVVE